MQRTVYFCLPFFLGKIFRFEDFGSPIRTVNNPNAFAKQYASLYVQLSILYTFSSYNCLFPLINSKKSTYYKAFQTQSPAGTRASRLLRPNSRNMGQLDGWSNCFNENWRQLELKTVFCLALGWSVFGRKLEARVPAELWSKRTIRDLNTDISTARLESTK